MISLTLPIVKFYEIFYSIYGKFFTFGLFNFYNKGIKKVLIRRLS